MAPLLADCSVVTMVAVTELMMAQKQAVERAALMAAS
jgi:hypothetical protein